MWLLKYYIVLRYVPGAALKTRVQPYCESTWFLSPVDFDSILWRGFWAMEIAPSIYIGTSSTCPPTTTSPCRRYKDSRGAMHALNIY